MAPKTNQGLSVVELVTLIRALDDIIGGTRKLKTRIALSGMGRTMLGTRG